MAVYRNKKMSKSRKLLQYGKRITACAAALTMTITACGIAAGSTEAEQTAAEEAVGGTEAGQTVEEAVDSAETEPEEAEESTEAAKKEETVYVIADAAGEPQNVIVSDRLDNEAAADTIADETELSDIENIKGDETPTQTEDGEMEWEASGDDIFYQGTTDKELPVTISVTYTLDGEEMSPEEIAGKSGDVVIRYDYTNNEEREVEIEGTETKLHVPFTVVTGFLVDEDSLTDVEITNGRLLSDGERTIAVGIAFPGLAEDLEDPAYESLTKLAKADVPSYVEIKGHTDNFSWGTGYTLVTNEIFSASDMDAEPFIDEVFGKLSALKDGVNQIFEGATKLNEGAGELKNGASDLADGLGTLTENNEALTQGAQEIFNGVLDSVKEQLVAAGAPVEELNAENYEQVLGMILLAADEESKEKISSAIEKLNSLKEFCSGLTEYTDGVAAAKAGADQLSDGSSELQSGTAALLLGAGVLNGSIPDLSGIPDVLKESIALGESYNSFAGIADGMEGKVRFIWKLEGIE